MIKPLKNQQRNPYSASQQLAFMCTVFVSEAVFNNLLVSPPTGIAPSAKSLIVVGFHNPMLQITQGTSISQEGQSEK